MWKYYLTISLEGIVMFIWCKVIDKLAKKFPK